MQKLKSDLEGEANTAEQPFCSGRFLCLYYLLPIMLFFSLLMILASIGFAYSNFNTEYQRQFQGRLAEYSEHLHMIMLAGRMNELQPYLAVVSEQIDAAKIELRNSRNEVVASYARIIANAADYPVNHSARINIQNHGGATEIWRMNLSLKPPPFAEIAYGFIAFQAVMMLVMILGAVAGLLFAFERLVNRPLADLRAALCAVLEKSDYSPVPAAGVCEFDEMVVVLNRFIKAYKSEIDRLSAFSRQAKIVCFNLGLDNETFDFVGNIGDVLEAQNVSIRTMGDLHALVNPEYRGNSRQVWYDLKERILKEDAGSCNYELRLLPCDDADTSHIEEKWVALYFVWHTETGDKHLSGVLKNISISRRREIELQSYAEHFRRGYEETPVGIWRSQGDHYVYMNAAMAEILGYKSPEEAVSRIKSITHEVYFSPVDRTFFHDELKKHDQAKNFEFRFKKADGTMLWGVVWGFMYNNGTGQICEGGVIDITDRKQADDRLRGNEEFLRQILDAAEVVLWQLDTASGKMLLRGAVDSLLGYGAASVDSIKGFQKLIHPEDFNHFLSGLEKMRHHEVRSTQDTGHLEFRVCNSGADKTKIKWLMAVSGQSAVAGSGKPGLLRGLMLDISPQKEAEKQLAILVDRAKNESRNKSEFFTTISHEIRTPLNAIVGYSELLVPLIGDPKARQYVGSIFSASRSLINTVNSILDLTCLEAGKIAVILEPVRLSEVIEDIRNQFAEEASRKKIDLSIALDTGIPKIVLLDEIRVRQILSNLVSNAIKFTSVGGVCIKASAIRYVTRQSLDLSITVEDSGIGIHENDLQEIFKPFLLKNGQKLGFGGSGLGLAICKALVELMNGKIVVKSDMQCGSRFEITLFDVRVAGESSSSLAPQFKERHHYNFQGQKILVADDTASNRELISEAMRSAGLEVICASDGNEALACAIKEKPEMIFMDIKMPGKDGITAARELKNIRELASVPIVAVTASNSIREQRELANIFDGFLNKPVSLLRLFAEAGRFLKHDEITLVKPETADVALPPEFFEQITDPWGLVDGVKGFAARLDEFEGAIVIEDALKLATDIKSLAVKHSFNCLTLEVELLIQCIECFDITGIAKSQKSIGRIFKQLLNVYSRSSN